MAVVVNSFSRTHVVSPSRHGDFGSTSANSEITVKTRSVLQIAVDALDEICKMVHGKDYVSEESMELDDEMLIKLLYCLSKSLSRRSLAYKQIIMLRMKENRLPDLPYFMVCGWKMGDVEGISGPCWIQCHYRLPLNEEAKNRVRDGPYYLRTGLRAAKKIASAAPIGALLIPSVKNAVAGYTAALAPVRNSARGARGTA